MYVLSTYAKNLLRLLEQGYSPYLDNTEHVDIACYVSKLLFDNIKVYFSNELLVVYNSFLVQQNTINEHRESLVKL